MKVEIDLPEIDGYEYTGEFRNLNKGDYYLNTDALEPCVSVFNTTDRGFKYPVLRKIEAPIVDGYTWDGKLKRCPQEGEYFLSDIYSRGVQKATANFTCIERYIYTKGETKPTPQEIREFKRAAMFGNKPCDGTSYALSVGDYKVRAKLFNPGEILFAGGCQPLRNSRGELF